MATIQNLFAPTAAQASQETKAAVEFKAGKMTLSGKTVTADKRKGVVQVMRGPDGLMHFIWKDRTTGAIEDDLIVFPEEASFKRVRQSSGRVYMLEFNDSTRKLFFWMQEPKDDKDEEICNKINQSINNSGFDSTI